MEFLPYEGQSPQDRLAFERYKQDLQRGKSLKQLQAIAAGVTPQIRNSWSPRSFTSVTVADGTVYDAVVCNISYHFNKHGARFGDISQMTQAGRQYFSMNHHLSKPTKDGLLKLPNGSLFEADGRIVTYFV